MTSFKFTSNKNNKRNIHLGPWRNAGSDEWNTIKSFVDECFATRAETAEWTEVLESKPSGTIDPHDKELYDRAKIVIENNKEKEKYHSLLMNRLNLHLPKNHKLGLINSLTFKEYIPNPFSLDELRTDAIRGGEGYGLRYIDKSNELHWDDKPISSIDTELCGYDHNERAYDIHKNYGTGVSQILPCLGASLKRRQKQKIISIEQPELHLHPDQECEAMDSFIINTYLHENLTYLLETHSEHMLLRLLKELSNLKIINYQ